MRDVIINMNLRFHNSHSIRAMLCFIAHTCRKYAPRCVIRREKKRNSGPTTEDTRTFVLAVINSRRAVEVDISVEGKLHADSRNARRASRCYCNYALARRAWSKITTHARIYAHIHIHMRVRACTCAFSDNRSYAHCVSKVLRLICRRRKRNYSRCAVSVPQICPSTGVSKSACNTIC